MHYTFYLGNDRVSEVTADSLNDACRSFGNLYFPEFGIRSWRQLVETVGKQYSVFIGMDLGESIN